MVQGTIHQIFGKDYSKSYELISMKFPSGVEDGIRNSQSNFWKGLLKKL